VTTHESTRSVAPETPEAKPSRARGRRSRRGRLVVLLVLLLLVVGVALAVLARPLLSAKKEADAAQSDLTAAKNALADHQVAQARQYVAQARTHLTRAQDDADGLGGDVWSHVPVAGGAVQDARYLIDALDQTTSVAELGVKVYPMVSGDSATLVRGQRIDMDTLHTVVDRTSAIGPHLDQAISDLDQVQGSTPFLGSTVDRAKETAVAYLAPLQETYANTAPVLQALPGLVGAQGPRTDLLAMLNPAELRYSGGATLSFASIRFDHGTATFGPTHDVYDILSTGGQYETWTPVRGNPFHREARARVTSATFSPWWGVSGEELLRGYEEVYPSQPLDGVIGIDLQGLAQLFTITGPVDLPNVGHVTADNLVQKLAGSYEQYPSVLARHQVSEALVPAFRQKFFEGGQMSAKVRSLVDSAASRHFFTYFREHPVERAFARIGLAGNLSRTPHDYLGVFTQNLNGSKTDYWQHRQVASEVSVNDDGSARVHLAVTVTNGSPPYALPVPDPKVGYTTRWLDTLLGVFLPKRAVLGPVTMDGQPVLRHLHHPHARHVVNRRFMSQPMELNAGESSTLRVSYTVPHAAAVTSDAAMTYYLDIDPQPTVVPENVAVDVTWPDGWSPAGPLPEGWEATATGASYHHPVSKVLSFAFPLARD
jgi:Protein of unknown function (DUF4012)